MRKPVGHILLVKVNRKPMYEVVTLPYEAGGTVWRSMGPYSNKQEALSVAVGYRRAIGPELAESMVELPAGYRRMVAEWEEGGGGDGDS
jgi:hypothetical protein